MSLDMFTTRLAPIAPAFIDAAIRGAFVLLAALLLTHVLRRRSAAARHLIWVGAVLVQLMLPILSLWGPQWNVAVSPTVASMVPLDIPMKSSPALQAPIAATTNPPVANAVAASVTETSRQQRATEESPRSTTRAEILAALWALGLIFILGRLAIGTAVVARLARKGDRVDDGNWLSLAQKLSIKLGIDRPLTLLRGNKVGVPVTWGIVYPVVLLPEGADEWPEERRTFVLVHEMAHVKRLDALTQLAGQLALAIFWFNPLVWVANRRLQLEREHACDDYVIRHGTTPSTYAEELLTMVRSLGTSDRSAQPAFAALAMARRSEFEGRMLSILDPVLDRHPLSRSRTALSAAVALLLVVPLAALRPYERANVVERADPVRTVGATLPAAPRAAPAASRPEPLAKLSNLAKRITGTLPVQTAVPPNACAKVPPTSGESVHLHSDDDDGGAHPVVDYLAYTSTRCTSASFRGIIDYSPKEDDVMSLAPGAVVSISARTNGDDRNVTLVSGADGAPVRRYSVNGRDADYDDSARRWFASVLPSVLTEAAINTVPRVSRWRTEGGVNNVLANTEALRSTSAKRSHFEALLSLGRLTAEEQSAVAGSAARAFQASSGDLRAVLSHLGATLRFPKGATADLQTAVAGITSNGDKAAILQAFGQTDDRDMLLGVVRIAQTIGSSGDRARLLQIIAPRYLTKNDRGLEDAFYDAVIGIPSSGDMRNTLLVTMPYGGKREGITRRIIEASNSVASSGDRSAVLISLVNTGAVNTRELKDAFFKSVAGIPSEGDRSRVLQASVELLK